jgi:hypothetical protein
MAEPTGSSSKKSEPSDFTIVNASEVAFIKRGRKSKLDDNLVQALRTLPKGKAIVLSGLRQNPNDAKYGNAKSRVSSNIRTACRAANMKSWQIKWAADGTPHIEH